MQDHQRDGRGGGERHRGDAIDRRAEREREVDDGQRQAEHDQQHAETVDVRQPRAKRVDAFNKPSKTSLFIPFFVTFSSDYFYAYSPYLQCFDAVGRQEGHPACINRGVGAGVVTCLEQGTDLHMAQLMPLPLTVSCFSTDLPG